MSTVQQRKKAGPLAALSSPVGRKVLTGVTGIVWVLFALFHMLGNLGYFSPNPDAYNLYTNFLIGLGPLLYLAEGLLLLTILVHVYLGISIYLGKRRARKQGYVLFRSAGEPSRMSFSSMTMIFTGIVLLVFLVVHLISFKYGPGVSEGYVSMMGDEPIRDLKRLVTERFQSPFYTFGYLAFMVLLAFHLRHGVWSAFQSIGTMNARLTPFVYGLGTVLAILIALGFMLVPFWIYFMS